MAKEIWKPVSGLDGFYEVSNLGRVRSLPRMVTLSNGVVCRKQGYVLTPFYARGQGAPRVRVQNGGSIVSRRLCDVVAEAFLGPLPDGKELVFVDGDFNNCRLSNLRYCKAETIGKAAVVAMPANDRRARLPERDVKIIRAIAPVMKYADIAALFGTSMSNVSVIVTGKSWQNV